MYIFSKEKFIKDMKRMNATENIINLNLNNWVNEADGKEVIFDEKRVGHLDEVKEVSKDWCIEQFEGVDEVDITLSLTVEELNLLITFLGNISRNDISKFCDIIEIGMYRDEEDLIDNVFHNMYVKVLDKLEDLREDEKENKDK